MPRNFHFYTTLASTVTEWVQMYIPAYKVTHSILQINSEIFLKISQSSVKSLGETALNIEPAYPIWWLQKNYLQHLNMRKDQSL